MIHKMKAESVLLPAFFVPQKNTSFSAKWRAYGLKVTSLPIEGDELPAPSLRMASSPFVMSLILHIVFASKVRFLGQENGIF